MSPDGAPPGDASSVEVRRDDAERCYSCEVDGQRAIAQFERDNDTITFTHTLVPPAIEGHGVGHALVRYALDDARANQWRVVPKCAFVQAFIERHPDYQSLVRA